jgi:hypothetical protein
MEFSSCIEDSIFEMGYIGGKPFRTAIGKGRGGRALG